MKADAAAGGGARRGRDRGGRRRCPRQLSCAAAAVEAGVPGAEMGGRGGRLDVVPAAVSSAFSSFRGWLGINAGTRGGRGMGVCTRRLHQQEDIDGLRRPPPPFSLPKFPSPLYSHAAVSHRPSFPSWHGGGGDRMAVHAPGTNTSRHQKATPPSPSPFLPFSLSPLFTRPAPAGSRTASRASRASRTRPGPLRSSPRPRRASSGSRSTC